MHRTVIRLRRRGLALAAFLLALPLVLPRAGHAARPDTAIPAMWRADRFHRVAVLALLEELRGNLLSETSATLTLERWCRAHRIGPADATVVAEADPAGAAAPDAAQRALLAVPADEPVRARRVRLLCGGVLLSEADNWYVPGRLTPDMNRVLDTTHTPFGKAIAALRFSRTTLSSRLPWSPLPADWATRAAPPPEDGPLSLPDTLIENEALLRDHANRPLALVRERYKPGILAFPPPTP